MTEADLHSVNREQCERFWHPSAQLLRSIRGYQQALARPGPLRRLRCAWWVVWHRFWSAVSGADIPLNAHIGLGLQMPHPNGVVIHPRARIGRDCLVFQQTTIGEGGSVPGVPTIGDHVMLGAGSRILGGIRIGHGARVGANAVVLADVPDAATVGGIPARILRTSAPPNDLQP